MTYSGSRWEGERAIFFGNVEIMGEGVGIAEELSIRNGESNEVRTRIKNTLLNLGALSDNSKMSTLIRV